MTMRNTCEVLWPRTSSLYVAVCNKQKAIYEHIFLKQSNIQAPGNFYVFFLYLFSAIINDKYITSKKASGWVYLDFRASVDKIRANHAQVIWLESQFLWLGKIIFFFFLNLIWHIECDSSLLAGSVWNGSLNEL